MRHTCRRVAPCAAGRRWQTAAARAHGAPRPGQRGACAQPRTSAAMRSTRRCTTSILSVLGLGTPYIMRPPILRGGGGRALRAAGATGGGLHVRPSPRTHPASRLAVARPQPRPLSTARAPVCALVHGDLVAHLVQLVRRRQARGAAAHDGDLVAGAQLPAPRGTSTRGAVGDVNAAAGAQSHQNCLVRAATLHLRCSPHPHLGRARHHPALLKRLVDDGHLHRLGGGFRRAWHHPATSCSVRGPTTCACCRQAPAPGSPSGHSHPAPHLDGDGVLVDAQIARALARRGAHTPGELREAAVVVHRGGGCERRRVIAGGSTPRAMAGGGATSQFGCTAGWQAPPAAPSHLLVCSRRSSASRQRPLCTRSLNSGILRDMAGGQGQEVGSLLRRLPACRDAAPGRLLPSKG